MQVLTQSATQGKEPGGTESRASLWAQVIVTSSAFHQGASHWPMAGVPPGRVSGRDWRLVFHKPCYLGLGGCSELQPPSRRSLGLSHDRKAVASAGHSSGHSAHLPWALDHLWVGRGWKEPEQCPWREKPSKAGRRGTACNGHVRPWGACPATSRSSSICNGLRRCMCALTWAQTQGIPHVHP